MLKLAPIWEDTDNTISNNMIVEKENDKKRVMLKLWPSVE
jgi:hypothetical protein